MLSNDSVRTQRAFRALRRLPTNFSSNLSTDIGSIDKAHHEPTLETSSTSLVRFECQISLFVGYDRFCRSGTLVFLLIGLLYVGI